MLYIVWVLTHVWWRVSANITPHRTVSLPWKCPVLPAHPSCLLSPEALTVPWELILFSYLSSAVYCMHIPLLIFSFSYWRKSWLFLIWGNQEWSGLDFPRGPVAKIPPFHCRGHGFDPWLGKFHMPLGVDKKGEKKRKAAIDIPAQILCER